MIINYNSKREDLEEEDQRQDERNVILNQINLWLVPQVKEVSRHLHMKSWDCEAVGLLLRKIQVINGPNGSKIDYRKIKERNPER